MSNILTGYNTFPLPPNPSNYGVISTRSLHSLQPVPSGTITELSVKIILPDGTVEDLTPTVDSTTRIMSIDYEAKYYGVYNVVWSCVYGTSTFSEQDIFTITYTDVRKSIISLMQLSNTETDNQLDQDKYNTLVAGMILYWENILRDAITSYDSLGYMYGSVFDMALTISMSCFLRPYTATSEDTSGEVAAVGTGPDKIEYHRRYAQISIDSEGELCSQQIWTLLNTIPVIAAWNDAFNNSACFFKTAGRRQTFNRDYPSQNRSLYNIYGDDMVTYLFAGGYINELYAGQG